MKYLTFVLLFLVYTLPLSGQKVKFNKGKALEKSYYIELNYEEIKSKLIIPVEIEGKEYRFLFDTGAPNLISHSLEGTIETKMLGSIGVRDANNKKNPLDVVRIPLLSIGGVQFKNSAAIVNDAKSNFLFECLEVDGIIGSNLVRNSIVQVDAMRKIIIITNQAGTLNLQHQDYLDMALDANQSSPYIWIDLVGEKKAREQVLFDTGAQGFYDMSTSSFDTLNEFGVFSHTGMAEGFKGLGMFGVSEPTRHYRVMVSEMGILGHAFSNVISVSTPSVKSRIGADIFEFGIVTMNFKDRRFYFQAYQDTADLQEEVWSFSPTVQDGKLVVGLVWDKDLSNQMSFGDKILKINDLNTESIKICDLLVNESMLKEVQELTISIETKEGEQNEIRLEKYRLGQVVNE